MDRRVIVALGLSLFVLISFQFIMGKLYPQPLAPLPAREIMRDSKAYQKEELPSEVQTEAKTILPAEKEIIFQNKLYTVVFTDIGAGIKSITLNENKEVGLNIPYEVVKVKEPLDSLFLFTPDKTGLALNNVKYDYRRTDKGIVFTHKFNGEFILVKTFRFDNSLYSMELELNWTNVKGGDIIKRYSIVSGVNMASSSMDNRFFEISANLDGKIVKNKKSGKQFEIVRNGNLSWIMEKNRYFSVITRPFSKSFGYSIAQDQKGKLTTAISMQEFEMSPDSTSTQRYGIYMGPSKPELVKAANIGIENALSYGILGNIGQLLMGVLRFFHRISRNWGVAILMLGIFINLVLFPLTRKSYKSMQEMQILQPKIEKIRQEHKSNPQKQQKEIMELYKKNKVNPMGGCLPMILQMPVFFALYQGLINFVELRGARFLWVKDLSVPENIPLPFQLPLMGNSLNILPLLMVVIMFFQQRLSNRLTSLSQTTEQRQQQKIMTVVMTFMFGFIFYNMPSGFVLYWLSSTLIMTVIQSMLTRKPRHSEEHA
jgi:YidC/Oxa1 family membrane protein insertase